MTAIELKALRESTGLSQEHFAVKVLDVASATVSRWECGTVPIPHLTGGGIRVRVAAYLRSTAET